MHDRISARFFVEFTTAMNFTLNGAGALKMPLLMIQGLADPIISPEGAQRFFDAAGGADKKILLCADQLHEVHNDTDKEKALSLVLSWLQAHSRD